MINKPIKEIKCKHNVGWLPIRNTYIFIFDDEKVTFNFQSHNKKSYKMKVRCNNPNCDSERNVYISAEVVKWGKIKNANNNNK